MKTIDPQFDAQPEEFDPLLEPLKSEAAETAPDFSTLLHARIMKSIKSEASHRSAEQWSLRWGGGIAAAILLAASLGIWLQATDNRPRDPVKPNLSVNFNVTRYARTAMRELQNAQFARLDEDATHLAKFLYRQIDVLPDRQ